MRLGFKKRLLAIVAVALCAAGAAVAVAEQRELKGASSDKIDAVVLLDSSGSMRLTDPARLRDEGARLFTQFLKPGDRLAILEFSSDAKVLRPLSDYESGQADQIAKDIQKIDNSGLYTDLLGGIRAASSLLDQNKREGADQMIVLLSDGKMEPDPARGTAAAATDELKNSLLPEIKGKDIRIHTLSFSDKADQELLKAIAVATDGATHYAPDADSIHSAFVELSLAAKKPQVLPLTSKGFNVDPAVDEATFYINREEDEQVTLISPTGQQLTKTSSSDQIKWFTGKNFDVITLKQPAAGTWGLSGLKNNEGFATLLTNLKLVTDWPASIYEGAGALLQARLYEGEKPVVLQEMNEGTQYGVQIVPTDRVSEPVFKGFLNDKGEAGDLIAGDGIFSARIQIDEEGEYKLSLLAKAPTFERSQQVPFRVRPRLVSLRVLGAGEAQQELEEEEAHGHGEGAGGEHAAAHEHGQEEHGEEEHEAPKHEEEQHDKASNTDSVFEIELSDEALKYKAVEVKLQATDAQRKKFQIPLEKVGNEGLKYRVEAGILPHDGKFTLQATLSGEGRKKERIKETSQLISFDRRSGAEEDGAKVVVVEDDVKKVEAHTSGGFPSWIFLIVVTVLNGGLGYASALLLRKFGAQSIATIPAFPPNDVIMAAIATLEATEARVDVPLNDPLFTDESIEFKLLPGSGSSEEAPSEEAEPEASEPEAQEMEAEEAH